MNGFAVGPEDRSIVRCVMSHRQRNQGGMGGGGHVHFLCLGGTGSTNPRSLDKK